MDKDEALRLALKALKKNTEHLPFDFDYHFEAITAIKQALANDALDRMADNERELGIQMQPEPVAWIDEFGNTFPLGAQRGPKYLNQPMKPLYTSPPKREPLTDEQIAKEVEAELTHYWKGEYIDTTGARDQLTAFARAIEAAHGIKGEA